MVLTLYGYPISSNASRVAVVLREKKVPFKFVSIDIFNGEHKSPDVLQKHPFGQIPYIVEDDGFTLFESRTICRYLATKYADQGTPLVPSVTDLRGQAKLDEATFIETTQFFPYAQRARFEYAVNGRKNGVVDQSVIDAAVNELSPKLDVYETILSKQKYLGGNELTVADLNHIPFGATLELLGGDGLHNEARPHVAAWWKGLKQRPSWQTVKDGITSVESYD